MARKSLLYYLFSKEKRPLYEDAIGNVQQGDPGNYTKPDGQPAHLRLSPRGWKNTVIKYARNIKYWGLFRDFTVPMDFVGDGAKILKNRMWMFGIECICYLGILRLDRITTPYNYENYFLSELNFSKYKQNQRGVTVEALEGGLIKLFKANEGTVYDIPVSDDPEKFRVKMDGKTFDYSTTYLVIPQHIAGTVNYYLGMINQGGEGNLPYMIFEDVMQQASAVYPNDAWFLNSDGAPIARNIRVHGFIEVYFDKTSGPVLRVETNDGGTGGFPQYELLNLSASPRAAGSREILAFDQTFSLPANTRINMKIFGGNPVDPSTQFTVDSGEIKIDYEYRYDTTWTDCIYPLRALDRIINKMSAGQYTVVSDWLSTKKDDALTCGDALRNLPHATMKSSLQDWFKSINHYGIGLTVENNVLRIEPFSYFFKNTLTADLGEVAAAEISVAEDLLISTIKVGQEPNDYEDVNGRDEPNQSQQWTTPGTRVIKELDLLSKYRKDSLGVELARIQRIFKDTTDARSDNDIFMLNITTENTAEEQNFLAEVTEEVDYAGGAAALVIHQNLSIGTGFTANTAKTEYTYGAGPTQSVNVDLTITPAGGGVANITVNLLQNAAVVASMLVAPGATGNLSTPLNLAAGDVLSVQIDDFVTAVTIEESEISFAYVPVPDFELNRPAFDDISGILHPETAFNVLYSPKTVLLNNGSYLRSLFPFLDGEKIKFQSADKNKELSYTLDGVTVTEKEDIQIGTLADRLFLPFYFNFTTKLPINVLALIQTNPYGRIRFTVEGVLFEGFLFDGGVKPGTEEKQNWKLLCAAYVNDVATDLSTFKLAA